MSPVPSSSAASGSAVQRWLPWLAIAAVLVGLELGLRLAALIGPWLATTPWPAVLREPVLLYVNFLAAVLPLTLIERWTSGTGQPRPLLRGLLFWAVAILLAWLVTLLTREILAALGLKPLLSLKVVSELPAPLAWLSGAGLLWLMMVVYDFFYYWFHRWQHTYGWLWRVHRVHHAIDDLSAANSYHHALEDLLRLPVVTIPFSLLIEVQVPTLALMSAFVAGWGWFIHLDSRYSLGRLGHWIGDNHYHRVHHSLRLEHHNRNYAAFFPPWDRLFGTQVLPPPDAGQLPVGLSDLPAAKRLGDYLLMPFWRNTPTPPR
jgi:sterol desaturase/sphingolipid hydroxylase (fatty acid hydroxylase superfamily)